MEAQKAQSLLCALSKILERLVPELILYSNFFIQDSETSWFENNNIFFSYVVRFLRFRMVFHFNMIFFINNTIIIRLSQVWNTLLSFNVVTWCLVKVKVNKIVTSLSIREKLRHKAKLKMGKDDGAVIVIIDLIANHIA